MRDFTVSTVYCTVQLDCSFGCNTKVWSVGTLREGLRPTNAHELSLSSSAMLPPVAEALSLIDLNQDSTSNPTAFRRAIQILVDHVQYQSVQLSRCEDILAAYGNPTQQGGTVWSKVTL